MITLAVDLGGTLWKAGVVRDGSIVHTATAPARSHEGLRANLPRLADFLRELAAGAGVAVQDCTGVAASSTGIVDAVNGRVLSPSQDKYADAASVDLVTWCRESLGLPFRIENDAHAACLGEWRFGAGRNCDDLVMMTLGTGIGVSVVMRGKALRGRHSQAGVVAGHFVMSPNGRPCGCGGRGCIEVETSGATLATLAREDARFPNSALARELQVDYAGVFKHAAAGDELARHLRDRSLNFWAAHCVSLIHAFDPEKIIIGGGIIRSADVIIPHLQAWTDRDAWTAWGKVKIVPATLGNDAALLGLYALSTQTVEYL